MSSGKRAHTLPTRVPRHFPRFDIGGRVKRIAGVIADAASGWVDDACYRTAASLAYYAIFSIFPLLLVAVTVLGFLLGGDPSSRERIVASASNVLSPQFRALLDDTLASMQAHAQARGIGAVVGIITLVFGASGVFSELDTALNSIWGVREETSSGLRTTILRAVRDKAIAFAAVAGAGAILLASLLVSTALTAVGAAFERVVPGAIVWRDADALVSLGLATLVFAAIFRTIPRLHVAWKDVLGGAFFTAVAFGVLKHLLAWYLGHIGSYAAYGAVGAVLALLTWIYLVSLVLLFGAELTRAYAEREGSLSESRAMRSRRPARRSRSCRR